MYVFKNDNIILKTNLYSFQTYLMESRVLNSLIQVMSNDAPGWDICKWFDKM